MSRPAIFDRLPGAAAVISIALLLAGCGSSNKPSGQTSGDSSTTTTGAAATTAGGGQAANGQAAKGAGKTATSTTTASSTSASRTRYTAVQVAAANKLVGCVRSHGFKVPPPNLTGYGAVFRTGGVNVKSASYSHWARICFAETERYIDKLEHKVSTAISKQR